MIAKTKTNSSFSATTRYVVEKEKAQIIGGNMIGTDTNTLVAEFMVSRNLNPKVQAPCYHLMLSLPHQEILSDERFAFLGERHFATVVVLSRLTGDKAKLTTPQLRIKDEELNQLVDQFLDSEVHQYSFFIARHHDREHNHIHIVASRINEITTQAIPTWMQYPQSEWSARLLEKQFDLEPVPCSWESKTKALTRTQRDRVEKDGLPAAAVIRGAIDEVATSQPNLPQFIERLAQRGVLAQVSYHANGQVRGIKYSLQFPQKSADHQSEWLTLAGNQLNRHKYTLPKLQSELGISYVPERDDETLKVLLNKGRQLLIKAEGENPASPHKVIAREPLPCALDETFKLTGTEESLQPPATVVEGESVFLESPKEEKIQREEKDQPSALPPVQEPQHPLLQLTDIQLLMRLKQLTEWQRSRLPEPNLKQRKDGLSRLDEASRSIERFERQLASLQRERAALGPVRSLTRPFAVSPEVVAAKELEIVAVQGVIDNLDRRRRHLKAELESWHEQARVYAQWREESETKAMEQLAEDFKNPLVKARLEAIEQKYAIYHQAQYLLDKKGQPREGGRYYVAGRIYLIEERGKTMSISRQNCDQPLYIATDNRETVGIIEVSHCNLTLQDREVLQEAIRSLKKPKERGYDFCRE